MNGESVPLRKSPSGPLASTPPVTVAVTVTTNETAKFLTASEGGETDNEFLPVTGSDFAMVPGTSSDFELTAEGAILTYVGTKPRQAMVTLSLSMFNETSTTSHTFGVAVSYNGDLIGGNEIYGDAESLAGVQANNYSGDTASMSTTVQRPIQTLETGDTIQPVAAKEDGDSNMVVTGLVMRVDLL